MNVQFLRSAEYELDDAYCWYEEQSEGLGLEFIGEVESTIDRITSFPEAWQSLSKRTRRCQTHRFPYGIIYQVRKDGILIVAIAHLHRKPEYWKNRV